MSPGFAFILGAVVLPFLPKLLARIWLPAVSLMALLVVSNLEIGQTAEGSLWGHHLGLLQVDPLRVLLGLGISILMLLWGVFSWENDDKVERTAGLLYAGGALLAVFAGDWLLLFLGWEVMAIASTVVLLSARTQAAYRAAFRYFLVHISSGVLVLAGTSLITASTHSTAVGPVELQGLGPWLLFVGLATGAAVWPLQFWAPDAWPETTPTGGVLLGTLTPAVAAFHMTVVFAGTPLLLVLGVLMVGYGLLYALSTRNLRRLVAYAVVAQVGLVLMGAGAGWDAKVVTFSPGQSAAVAHVFVLVLVAALLFMASGAVLHRTGRPYGGGLGILRRKMPWTFGFGIVGIATLSALPLTAGYASWTAIRFAVEGEGGRLAEVARTVLLLAAALTPMALGLRWLWLAFGGRQDPIEAKPSSFPMRLGMGALAVLCVAGGLFGSKWIGLLPEAGGFTWTWGAWLRQIGLVLLGTVLFFLWRSLTARTLFGRLEGLPDTGRLVRGAARSFVAFVEGPFERAMAKVSAYFHVSVPEQLGFVAQNPGGFMRVALERVRLGGAALFGSQGAIDRAQARFSRQLYAYRNTRAAAAWPIGQTVLFAALILAVALVIWLVG